MVGFKNQVLLLDIKATNQKQPREITTSSRVQWNLYQMMVLISSLISTKKGVCNTSHTKFKRKEKTAMFNSGSDVNLFIFRNFMIMNFFSISYEKKQYLTKRIFSIEDKMILQTFYHFTLHERSNPFASFNKNRYAFLQRKNYQI